MRRLAIAAALFLASVQTLAADPIPSNLIGVRATERSVLRGDLIFEGLAVYLGGDGVGAVVGGPPPIGVRIVFTYDPDAKTIAYRMTENGKTVRTGSMAYDPVAEVILVDKENLRRRVDQLTDRTRRALGLEPAKR